MRLQPGLKHRVSADLRLSGSSFQTCGAQKLNAASPCLVPTLGTDKKEGIGSHWGDGICEQLLGSLPPYTVFRCSNYEQSVFFFSSLSSNQCFVFLLVPLNKS